MYFSFVKDDKTIHTEIDHRRFIIFQKFRYKKPNINLEFNYQKRIFKLIEVFQLHDLPHPNMSD